MSGRGRPRTRDILTPREWEVLARLRQGLSNREIANELNLSLAGAKYHVSEIISKLGVSTREEAASWQREPPRRWGFAPFAALGGIRQGLASLVAKNLAVSVTLAVLALSGIGLAGVMILGGGSGSRGPNAAPVFDPCAGVPGCRRIIELRYTTVEEAAANASFVPMLPAALPAGFERYLIVASKRDFSNPYVPEVHDDWITVVYRNAAGDELVLSQGFPAWPQVDWFASLGRAEAGKLQVNGREAAWADNVPPQQNAADNTAYRTILTLFLGRFGTGWGEEGSFFSGSPMTYTIASDSLGLRDLISIAESVRLPEMLEPSPGVTVEPYFH